MNDNPKRRVKRKALSAASVQLTSGVRPKGISPGNRDDLKTVGMWLTPEDARMLATQLLALSYDKRGGGNIYITGHIQEGRLTVIRQPKGTEYTEPEVIPRR